MGFQSTLDPRFEIRPLEPRHSEWVRAILIHSNVFHSPLWSVLHRDTPTATAYAAFRGAAHLAEHAIASGYSLGVFDTQYRFRRPESEPLGGKLYWDLDDPNADGATLLEQMDFPLVSFALASDAADPPDMRLMVPLLEALPAFSHIYRVLDGLDGRDPEASGAKGPGELLMRNSTGTRHDYEGRGAMKNAAWRMMWDAAEKGFRGIEIVCSSDAVAGVWSHPPEPFSAEVVCEFDTATFEEKNEAGETTNLFAPARQKVCRIRCTLR